MKLSSETGGTYIVFLCHIILRPLVEAQFHSRMWTMQPCFSCTDNEINCAAEQSELLEAANYTRKCTFGANPVCYTRTIFDTSSQPFHGNFKFERDCGYPEIVGPYALQEPMPGCIVVAGTDDMPKHIQCVCDQPMCNDGPPKNPTDFMEYIPVQPLFTDLNLM